MATNSKMVSKKSVSNFKSTLYELVKKIPQGQLATYSQLASLAGNPKAARVVGNILHKNPRPIEIPCHRVVNIKGYLAKNFAFGGLENQKKLLEREEVKVIGGKVDLKECLFKPQDTPSANKASKIYLFC